MKSLVVFASTAFVCVASLAACSSDSTSSGGSGGSSGAAQGGSGQGGAAQGGSGQGGANAGGYAGGLAGSGTGGANTGGYAGGLAGSGTGGANTGGYAGGLAGSGTGGYAGGLGTCKKCSEMVLTAESDFTKVCPESAVFLNDFVACTCLPDNCGGTGKGCAAECAPGFTGAISQACQDCDLVVAQGACATQAAACLGDK